MAIISSTLARIKDDPLACLGGAERVNQLFAQAGHRWRKCEWDPAVTTGMFILQVLHKNTAISTLRHLSDLKVKESTDCEARMSHSRSGGFRNAGLTDQQVVNGISDMFLEKCFAKFASRPKSARK